MPTDGCPPPAALAAFHHGDLPAADIDRVAAHVEHCPACEAALVALEQAADTVAQAVRHAGSDSPPAPARVAAGTVIAGRYTLVEPLGEGGMGSVWLARQTAPVRRDVAVKLIKPGMDSQQVLARFEAERQALAIMDHPNIARVLDAGETAEGRPFFVMELVRGVPITDYCDARRLAPADRLALFVPVCDAVQHAHQKGVVHRDLKPSNVLVAEADGRPVPKVIDFGIAKATGEPLTARTLETGLGAIVGTPEYMAPEQAGADATDVDTRADVYALGVLLYELLTGNTPLTRQRLKQAALLEVLRLVREEEPPRPSDRLSTADGLPAVAANRQLDPKRLTALVRGELDWIVLKALEKDRERRYATAAGFAADVRRYLADDVVEARPPSAGYRLRKLLRRHRGPVTAAAAVAAVLVAATAVSVWQATRATRAESATAAALTAETAIRQDAEAVAGLLASVFDGLRTDNGAVDGETLKRRFAAKLGAVAASLAGRTADGDIRGSILRAVGNAQLGLGEYDAGRATIERAVADFSAKFGPADEGTLGALSDLASAHLQRDRPADAAPLLERVAAGYEARLGATAPRTLEARHDLAIAYRQLGREAEAVRIHEAVLAARRELSGPDHPDTLHSMTNLAAAYLESGRVADAVRLLEPARAGQLARLGPTHPDTVRSSTTLAVAYSKQNRLADALPLMAAAVAGAAANFGPDHPETLAKVVEHGVVLHLLGRPADAIPLLQRAATTLDQKLGPAAPKTTHAYSELGQALDALGRDRDAEAAYQRVVDGCATRCGPDSMDVWAARSRMAILYLNAGRAADAVLLYEGMVARLRVDPGPDDVNTLTAQGNLAAAYVEAGRGADAEAAFRHHIDHLRRLNATPAPLSSATAGLGRTLFAFAMPAAAEPVLREALGLSQRERPNSWETFETQALLGACLLSQGKPADAEPLLLAGYAGVQARIEKMPRHRRPVAAATAGRLAELYEAAGRPADAATWAAARANGPGDPATKR